MIDYMWQLREVEKNSQVFDINLGNGGVIYCNRTDCRQGLGLGGENQELHLELIKASTQACNHL